MIRFIGPTVTVTRGGTAQVKSSRAWPAGGESIYRGTTPELRSDVVGTRTMGAQAPVVGTRTMGAQAPIQYYLPKFVWAGSRKRDLSDVVSSEAEVLLAAVLPSDGPGVAREVYQSSNEVGDVSHVAFW
jgi:hypothetical protein